MRIGAIAKKYILKHSPNDDRAGSSASENAVRNETAGTNANLARHQALKLPPLSISPFNGDIEQWSCFRDTFHALVHSRQDITNIEKFHHLRSALQGPAAQLIHLLTFRIHRTKRLGSFYKTASKIKGLLPINT